jgi:hypothetical protein
MRSMTRVRQRVKEMTGRHRNGVKDVRVIIRDINPVLRGWGHEHGLHRLRGTVKYPEAA